MVKYSGIHFTIQDMSGAAKYRSLWKECLDQVQGIIFVIDSADDMRFSVVQSELMELLGKSRGVAIWRNAVSTRNVWCIAIGG